MAAQVPLTPPVGSRAATLPARWMDRAARGLGGIPTRWFLAGLILVQLVLHAQVISLPPLGQHTWRQVMWAAAARNYYEEDGRFFYPRHDVRIAPEDPGYLYHEFPLLFWIIGESYHLTGEHDLNGRLVVFAMSAVLILASYRLLRLQGTSERLTRWFLFFLSGAPLFFYYSVTLESNLPALAWFVLGLALLLPELQRGSLRWPFWAGLALLLLGTLSKQTLLFFGLPVAFLFAYQYSRQRKPALLWAGALGLLVILAVHALIYRHTLALYQVAPLERQGYWELKPIPPPQSWAEIKGVLLPTLLTWIPELYINSAAVPLFLVGLWQIAAHRRSGVEARGFWLWWLLSLIAFVAFFFTRLREHEYYLTPLVLLTALVSAVGVDFLLQRRGWRWMAVALVLIVPLVMVGRVYHRWTVDKQVPEELLDHAAELQGLIPPAARVLVVGDNSPVIFLYYLHRKGVAFPDLPAAPELDRVLGNGYRWVVSLRPLAAIPALARMGQVRGTVGRFTVLQLTPPAAH